MAYKCIENGCNNEIFKGNDRCALHCDKSNCSSGLDRSLLSEFYKLLCSYIVNELFGGDYPTTGKFYEQQLKEFLKEGELKDEVILNGLKDEVIFFNKIAFPERKGRVPLDYLKLLRLFKGVNFNLCSFNCRSLELKDTATFFQGCVFNNAWSLYDYQQLTNVANVLYQDCIFNGEVDDFVEDLDGDLYHLNSNQFNYGCKFNNHLNLAKLVIKADLFSSQQVSQNYSLEIEKFTLSNARIGGKFAINNLSSKALSFSDVEFDGKFELKNSSVKNIEITNCNFSKVSDFYNSKFECFKIEKSIFDEFSGFERCSFGTASAPHLKQAAVFKFVTFFDFASFRNSKFYAGLKLAQANFKSPPNFYNASIESKFTDRETYRIIKHSFDSVGNKLEANKYYSLELKAYKEELQSKKHIAKMNLIGANLCQQRLVFFINYYGSNFGQSFFRPIGIISGLMLVFMLLVLGYEANLLYRIAPSYNESIACFVGFFNNFSKALIPFKPLQREGMEFLSLFFGVIFSVLIWLTITAVKMHTRR